MYLVVVVLEGLAEESKLLIEVCGKGHFTGQWSCEAAIGLVDLHTVNLRTLLWGPTLMLHINLNYLICK